MTGAAQSGIDDDRHEGAVQTILVGQAGQLGIGHALGDDQGGHRDPGCQVVLQAHIVTPVRLMPWGRVCA